MLYPNLFKSRYTNLQGRNWLTTIEPEDKKAFIEIGLQATDYGAKGGQTTVKKYGRKHMKRIGRIGAIATNIRKEWNKAFEAEIIRLQEVAIE